MTRNIQAKSLLTRVRTGAGIVADSGQPAFRPDLSEDEKSLAAVLASVAASKNSCANVTAEQEVSAKTLAEELKTGVRMTVDLKRFEVMTMVKRLEEHFAVLSQLASRVSTILEEMKQSFCPCVSFLVAEVGWLHLDVP